VLSLLALQIAGNALVMFWARRRRAVSAWVSAATLGTDFLFLTILLALTGGAANPFSM